MFKKILIAIAVLTAIVMVAGAAYFKIQRDAVINEASLRKRVTEYWEAIRLNDHQTRYRMLIEYADGKLQPHELGLPMSPQMKLLSFKVGEIRIERDGTAEVDILPEFTMAGFAGKGFTMATKESWTYTHGEWFRGLRREERVQEAKPEQGQ